MNEIKTEMKERLKEVIFERTELGCMICVSHKAKRDGYTMIYWGGKLGQLTRLLWTATYGDIPIGQVLIHTCDNPSCCNIDHIKLGTIKDNMADKCSKGRQAKGERCARTKLTDDAARYIKTSGELSHILAKKYDISINTVRQIRSGRIWKHV